MEARRAQPIARGEGACSFCGEHVRAVESSIVDIGICDVCVGLCCDVLAGTVGFGGAKNLAASSWSVRRIENIAAAVRAKAGVGEPRTGGAQRESFSCSFCGVAENHVAKLIEGPRVYMCETCVAVAVALIAHRPAVRWLKSYFADEDVWGFFEVDADGWVVRQVGLHGATQTPVGAAALAEWPDAETEGADAVRAYEAKYGALADQPMSEWDPEAPLESITRESFEEVWQRARESIDARVSG